MCSNHITTRISIQTAGLAFGGTGLCSYRVKGVDGSCAKHLTVESLRSFMLLTVILIIIIPSPMHSLFHSRLKTFLFCKSFPLQPFLFFFRTHSFIHIRLLRTVKPQLYTKIKQSACLKYIKVNTYFGTTF